MLLSLHLMLFADSEDSTSGLGKTLGEKVQHGVASAIADLKTLAKHPIYVLNVAGTAVYTGTQALSAQSYKLMHMLI